VEDWATADKRLQAEWNKAAEAGDRETLMGLREKLEENELRRYARSNQTNPRP
jgi:hypothetical protein